MIPEGMHWNQAIIPSGSNPLKDGMVVLISFKSDRTPVLIGVGFIISANGSEAVAITAAHNFDGIKSTQNDKQTHHSSAVPEFVRGLDRIDLDRKKVRVSCFNKNGVHAAVVKWAVWDKQSDIGFMGLGTQEELPEYFQCALQIGEPIIEIGSEVALLGYALQLLESKVEGQEESFKYSQQMLFRKGTITNYFPEGHILCRGPCIETSIPVISGMSGGPVFGVVGEGQPIKPFGLISSGPEDENSDPHDRTKPGQSIIALLKPDFEKEAGNSIQKLRFEIGNAQFEKSESES